MPERTSTDADTLRLAGAGARIAQLERRAAQRVRRAPGRKWVERSTDPEMAMNAASQAMARYRYQRIRRDGVRILATERKWRRRTRHHAHSGGLPSTIAADLDQARFAQALTGEMVHWAKFQMALRLSGRMLRDSHSPKSARALVASMTRAPGAPNLSAGCPRVSTAL